MAQTVMKLRNGDRLQAITDWVAVSKAGALVGTPFDVANDWLPGHTCFAVLARGRRIPLTEDQAQPFLGKVTKGKR